MSAKKLLFILWIHPFLRFDCTIETSKFKVRPHLIESCILCKLHLQSPLLILLLQIDDELLIAHVLALEQLRVLGGGLGPC